VVYQVTASPYSKRERLLRTVGGASPVSRPSAGLRAEMPGGEMESPLCKKVGKREKDFGAHRLKAVTRFGKVLGPGKKILTSRSK